MDDISDMMPILKDLECLSKKYNIGYEELMGGARMLMIFRDCLPKVTDPKIKEQRSKELSQIKEAEQCLLK